MNIERLQQIFEIGETVAIEFKQCSNGIEADTYESVCSFLNRFGGDIFLGVANELGSGVRRLYHYVPRYSGMNPELIDGDIFRIIVPLDDDYSYEVGKNNAQIKRNLKRNDDCALTGGAVLDYLTENPRATQVEIASAIGKSRRTVQDAIAGLKEKGKIDREGAKKNGSWIIKDS